MKFEYYYNNVPGKGLCRNNLIYTSLMSPDNKIFCKWYYNDSVYHKGKNKVVDPSLMQEKWEREIKYLTKMEENYPDHIPKIIDVAYKERKIFFEIDGVDFWESAKCCSNNYNKVLPNWQEQMLDILKSHYDLGLYKMSLHPSSYFVVDNKLKSINYFFTYEEKEKSLKIKDVLSHISDERLAKLIPILKEKDVDINDNTSLRLAQLLAFDSFKSNFPIEFINEAKKIYV